MSLIQDVFNSATEEGLYKQDGQTNVTWVTKYNNIFNNYVQMNCWA